MSQKDSLWPCYTVFVKPGIEKKTKYSKKRVLYALVAFVIVCSYYFSTSINRLKALLSLVLYNVPKPQAPSPIQEVPSPRDKANDINRLSIFELNSANYGTNALQMEGVPGTAVDPVSASWGPGPVFSHFNFFPNSRLISGTYQDLQGTALHKPTSINPLDTLQAPAYV